MKAGCWMTWMRSVWSVEIYCVWLAAGQTSLYVKRIKVVDGYFVYVPANQMCDYCGRDPGTVSLFTLHLAVSTYLLRR